MRYIIPIVLLYLLLTSCSTSQKSDSSSNAEEAEQKNSGFVQREPAIVYKTNEAYYDKVSIQLSEDGEKIISYPHPKDVFYKGKLALPTKLKKGYLLDNRGISENTAFLNISFEEYSRLESVPSLQKMKEMIIDKNPIIELYNCGDRVNFKDEVEELNDLIKKNLLEERCKRIK